MKKYFFFVFVFRCYIIFFSRVVWCSVCVIVWKVFVVVFEVVVIVVFFFDGMFGFILGSDWSVNFDMRLLRFFKVEWGVGCGRFGRRYGFVVFVGVNFV